MRTLSGSNSLQIKALRIIPNVVSEPLTASRLQETNVGLSPRSGDAGASGVASGVLSSCYGGIENVQVALRGAGKAGGCSQGNSQIILKR